MAYVMGGVARYVVIVVIYCVVVGRVAVFSFGVVSGNTDGSFCRSAADCIVVDSLVTELEGFHWHPGRIVLGWKIVSSWVVVVVSWIVSSWAMEISKVLLSSVSFFNSLFFI